MSERREAGGADERRIEPDIDFRDQIGNGLRAVIERGEDRSLALAAGEAASART